jgi:hypothetical protein
VGQVVNLRRIGNPPASHWAGRAGNADRLAAASRWRIAKLPQLAKLPHNGVLH